MNSFDMVVDGFYPVSLSCMCVVNFTVNIAVTYCNIYC